MADENANALEGEEKLAQHIAAHMDLSLAEARALVHKHGSDVKKINEERERLVDTPPRSGAVS